VDVTYWVARASFWNETSLICAMVIPGSKRRDDQETTSVKVSLEEGELARRTRWERYLRPLCLWGGKNVERSNVRRIGGAEVSRHNDSETGSGAVAARGADC
jgi:hypothetical protein